MTKLTELACANAKPRESVWKLHDTGGLHLVIRPTGAKTWAWKYRFGGREKKLTLGPYPLLSLKAARDARDRARLQLLEGQDPAAQKSAARKRARLGETFEELARSWHKAKEQSVSPKYAAEVLARLEANAFPTLGPLPIREITAPMVLEALRRIERRGAYVMAQEVRGHMSEVFVWAIASGLVDMDPAAMVRRAMLPATKGRRAALLSIEDLREHIRAIDRVKRAAPLTKLASRLLALTAVRPGVLRLAERQEFSLEGPEPIWRIPAAKMKLTRDRKADAAFDFVVPLSRQAVETVKAAMAVGKHKSLLFPGVQGTKAISDSTLSQLYLDAGYRDRHVPHGWRASFSTIMNERAGVSGRDGDRAIIDLMLAHIKGDVEAAYNRAAYMPRRRQLAQEWADLLCVDLLSPAKLAKLPAD